MTALWGQPDWANRIQILKQASLVIENQDRYSLPCLFINKYAEYLLSEAERDQAHIKVRDFLCQQQTLDEHVERNVQQSLWRKCDVKLLVGFVQRLVV